ncbi:hypothetical protein [Sphingopyxis sp. JAI128]|uniref:hypothetical protein n=1 Tax=Sphingopyxis sp. JAI128 TaxID=2723066 RepID=UPI00161FCA0E|nr:hypothetical protein [Sphingopyxis sp. JAI128]
MNYDRPRAHLSAGDEIANLDFYHIAALQLTVDRKVEPRSVPKPLLAIEKEVYRPDHRPFFQRSTRGAELHSRILTFP